ncbi:hypothetical protein J3R30DRAFT_3714050 [Lentinula aciculospora]|uniref:Uncharacterized protein n=1 Tax=Lentinula aciculospora TaxID=153920 RepID=A0A9W9DH63_9AGAR|nr:hypothetical protein J3R30DRAFT_3714050 [Lentinula aciculospora]
MSFWKGSPAREVKSHQLQECYGYKAGNKNASCKGNHILTCHCQTVYTQWVLAFPQTLAILQPPHIVARDIDAHKIRLVLMKEVSKVSTLLFDTPFSPEDFITTTHWNLPPPTIQDNDIYMSMDSSSSSSSALWAWPPSFSPRGSLPEPLSEPPSSPLARCATIQSTRGMIPRPSELGILAAMGMPKLVQLEKEEKLEWEERGR